VGTLTGGIFRGGSWNNNPQNLRSALLGDRIQSTALDVLEELIEATYTRDRRGHLAREKAPLLSGGNFSREVVRSKASLGGKESILFLIVSGIAYRL
jgi:hypothetical protein